MDCFVSNFTAEGEYRWTDTWGGSGHDEALGVSAGEWDVSYTTGYFNDTVNFDPGPTVDEHLSEGGDDSFLLKLLDWGTW
jgi:hypothetical protein